jgi:hypothetical protein
MRSATLIQRITAVCARVQQAAENWNGSDLDKMAASNQLLYQAMIELNEVKAGIEIERPEGADDLRAIISTMKREIARMGKVVDACSTLHRGLASCKGGSLSYTTLGPAVAETSGLEVQLQG